MYRIKTKRIKGNNNFCFVIRNCNMFSQCIENVDIVGNISFRDNTTGPTVFLATLNRYKLAYNHSFSTDSIPQLGSLLVSLQSVLDNRLYQPVQLIVESLLKALFGIINVSSLRVARSVCDTRKKHQLRVHLVIYKQLTM